MKKAIERMARQPDDDEIERMARQPDDDEIFADLERFVEA